MKKGEVASSWDKRPQGEELRKLIHEFGAALKEPDAQHILWGYKWVLCTQGNELPLSEETNLWAHFGTYVQWQCDGIQLRNAVVACYREGGKDTRRTIRSLAESDAHRNDFEAVVPGFPQERTLPGNDPWETEWLDAARVYARDPAFFQNKTIGVLVRESINAIDAQEEKASLSEHLPGGTAFRQARSYL